VEKPATALHGEPASNFELLGGLLDFKDTHQQDFIQAPYLSRVYALTIDTARAVAELAFVAGPR
jgi:hypothetical protein